MRAIDTNLLVRLVARDDAKQTAAAEEFVEKGGWVSHSVVYELWLGSVSREWLPWQPWPCPE